MKRSSLALVAVTLLAVVGTSLCSQGQPQNRAPRPARPRADETLEPSLSFFLVLMTYN